MFMVISYDVAETDTPQGAKRLRQIAKLCKNYGQRVQYSVFECHVGAKEWTKLKLDLLKAYDAHKDSLRFYHLGNEKHRIEHYGVKESIDYSGTLII